MVDHKSVRRRAAVSRNSRGHSIDITIEAMGYTNYELLAETKHLFALIDDAFPSQAPPKEEGK